MIEWPQREQTTELEVSEVVWLKLNFFALWFPLLRLRGASVRCWRPAQLEACDELTKCNNGSAKVDGSSWGWGILGDAEVTEGSSSFSWTCTGMDFLEHHTINEHCNKMIATVDWCIRYRIRTSLSVNLGRKHFSLCVNVQNVCLLTVQWPQDDLRLYREHYRDVVTLHRKFAIWRAITGASIPLTTDAEGLVLVSSTLPSWDRRCMTVLSTVKRMLSSATGMQLYCAPVNSFIRSMMYFFIARTSTWVLIPQCETLWNQCCSEWSQTRTPVPTSVHRGAADVR